jgi:hypothetical protein
METIVNFNLEWSEMKVMLLCTILQPLIKPEHGLISPKWNGILANGAIQTLSEETSPGIKQGQSDAGH